MPLPLLKCSILILSPYLRLGLPSRLFHSGFPTKILYATFLSPCALHVPPVPWFLIRSPELYFGRNADPKAPTHTVVSIPLLPCPKKKQPSAHAIKTWVNKFEETGSTVKKKGCRVKTVRTPQNIDDVRASFEQSPRRSAVRHSKKLGQSESSVRRNLHLDLHCGYRKRFQESQSTCYVGPWVVFTIGLLSVSSVMEGILRM